MGIVTETDRKTKKQITYVEGEVSGVFLNELKEIKSYPGTRGNVWTPTHSINLVVDGTRVSLGLTDREPPLRAKDGDGNYQDLVRGAEITLDIQENGEYKGVKQWQGRLSDIIITKPSPNSGNSGSQRGNSGGNTGRTNNNQNKDKLPLRLGNAITAASILAGKTKAKVSYDKVLEKALTIYPIVDSVREQLTKEYPDMDDYSLGSRLGQCVLLASEHYIKDIAELETLLPEMFKQTSETEATLRNQLSSKKEELVPEEAEEEVLEEDEGFDPDTLDDDIPF